MNFNVEIQLLLDWVRARLMSDFRSEALDVYTDDYDVAFDKLTSLASDIRKAASLQDQHSFCVFRDEYRRIFSETSIRVIANKLDQAKEELEDLEGETGEELSEHMKEIMALELVATKDFAHNFWANQLDNSIPMGYSDISRQVKDIRTLRKPFFKGDTNDEPSTHTDMFHRSSDRSFDSLYQPFPRKKRSERFERIKQPRKATEKDFDPISDYRAFLDMEHRCMGGTC